MQVYSKGGGWGGGGGTRKEKSGMSQKRGFHARVPRDGDLRGPIGVFGLKQSVEVGCDGRQKGVKMGARNEGKGKAKSEG